MMRKRIKGVRALQVLGILLVLVRCGSNENNSVHYNLLISNVNLISMVDEGVSAHMDVLINGDSIVGIRPTRAIVEKDSVEVIDAKGLYLIPGLIDTHVHLRKKETMLEYLKYGFTALRNMNGNFGDPLKWKNNIASDKLQAPDLYTSSPTIIGDRHAKIIRPDYKYAIRDEEQARSMANQFKQDGYDLIKIFRLERKPFYALVDEAEKIGIPISGHLPDVNLDGDSIPNPDISVDEILKTGMGVEHIVEFCKAAFRNDQSEERIGEVILLLKNNNIALSTLLGNDIRYYQLSNRGEAYLTDSIMAMTSTFYGDEGVQQLRSIIADQPDLDIDDNNSIEFVFRMIKRFNDAGVKLVIGTDSQSVINIAGLSSLKELDFLITAGLTNYEALKAATVNAAQVLGTSDQMGTIAVGKKANLILLKANPLTNISTLYSPHRVVLRGEIVVTD